MAWTTQKGFKNLISAQSHRAYIERQAREHQRDLNDASEVLRKNDKLKTVASAILAEFIVLLSDIHERQNALSTQIQILGLLGDKAQKSSLQFHRPAWHLPIWEKLNGEIGILGASHAADVFNIYGRTRLKDPGNEIFFPNSDMAIEVYSHMREELHKWSLDLLHVTSRLSAIIFDTADPGPLYLAPHKNAAMDNALGGGGARHQ